MNVTIKPTIELEHIGGPTSDAETLLDWFAGEIGQQNGAKSPLVLSILPISSEMDPPRSEYRVRVVD